MTPDERGLLTDFLSDLSRTPSAAKDPEADRMIADAVRTNPDAVYLLVQHAILADQALHATQAQLQEMQSQGAQAAPQGGSSFLPQVAGSGYAPPAGQGYAPQGGYYPQAPDPSSPWAGQQGAPVPSSPFAANSGLGGFLRSAGTMAAGVAAGDFLAQGISNIFSPRW